MPNADRLRKLADVIEEHPDRFDMSTWFELGDPDPDRLFSPLNGVMDVDMLAENLVCGTTACVAGWACALWPSEVQPEKGFSRNGAMILGIDSELESDMLFTMAGDAPRMAGVLRAVADGASIKDVCHEGLNAEVINCRCHGARVDAEVIDG